MNVCSKKKHSARLGYVYATLQFKISTALSPLFCFAFGVVHFFSLHYVVDCLFSSCFSINPNTAQTITQIHISYTINQNTEEKKSHTNKLPFSFLFVCGATNVLFSFMIYDFCSNVLLNICVSLHMIPAIKHLLLSATEIIAENSEQFQDECWNFVLNVSITPIDFYGSFCTAIVFDRREAKISVQSY